MPLRLNTERKAFGLTPMMRARSFVLTRLPQLAAVLGNFERFWRRK